MLKTLGPVGILGVVALLVGIGVIALENLQIAAGLAIAIVGLGMVVQGILTGLLKQWGMA